MDDGAFEGLVVGLAPPDPFGLFFPMVATRRCPRSLHFPPHFGRWPMLSPKAVSRHYARPAVPLAR
eukprot:5966409-Prymnesium_polylepis.1